MEIYPVQSDFIHIKGGGEKGPHLMILELPNNGGFKITVKGSIITINPREEVEVSRFLDDEDPKIG